MSQYIDDVAVPQVKELLTNYGDLAILWWDTPTGMTDEYAEKLNALLKLQPNIITNDRLKRPNYPGDYKTPEQRIPNLSELDGKDWETCMTMNETWGYKSYANNWKSIETLVRNLIDIASKGGNYLLNVGPKADGTFPQESIDILKGMGAWMRVNGEAIYDTKASPFGLFPWGRCTKKDPDSYRDGTNTTLYISVFDWPKDGKLTLPGLKNKVSSAKLLANGAVLKTKKTKEGLDIFIPKQGIDPIATVIKIEVKGIVDIEKAKSKDKMKTGELD
jgi:alpha-L-fucosidase